MKKHSVLVDTCIWIEYFKNNTKIVKVVDELMNEDTLYTTGVVIAELLYGLKTTQEQNLLNQCIDAVKILDDRTEDWKNSGLLGNALRKKGITIPLTDLLVSAIAVREDVCVFTWDKHFSQIPNLKLFEAVLWEE